jgi:hypothetical protein
VPLALAADIRLIDVFPRQKCAITIASNDTPRGVAYSGNLLPIAVTVVTDPETGYTAREVTFEAETSQDLAVTGDIPGGRADPSIPPPLPRLPSLPSFPVILPGTLQPSAAGPTRVIMHDQAKGLVYTENFDVASPTWRTVNAGLTSGQYASINWIGVCPNGALYVAFVPFGVTPTGWFVARAPSIGGTFVVQTITFRVRAIAVNPLAREQIGFITNDIDDANNGGQFFYGANDSYTGGATFDAGALSVENGLSYGQGKWVTTFWGHFNPYNHVIFNQDGSIFATKTFQNTSTGHLRASTTGIIVYQGGDGDVWRSEDNFTTVTEINTTDNAPLHIGAGATVADIDPTGQYLMTRDGSPGKIRSSDGGTTWVAIPNLVVGNWYFRNAGTPQRWIAANATVQYSANFGDSWSARTGNLQGIAPTPNINVIRVVEP